MCFYLLPFTMIEEDSFLISTHILTSSDHIQCVSLNCLCWEAEKRSVIVLRSSLNWSFENNQIDIFLSDVLWRAGLLNRHTMAMLRLTWFTWISFSSHCTVVPSFTPITVLPYRFPDKSGNNCCNIEFSLVLSENLAVKCVLIEIETWILAW